MQVSSTSTGTTASCYSMLKSGRIGKVLVGKKIKIKQGNQTYYARKLELSWYLGISLKGNGFSDTKHQRLEICGLFEDLCGPVCTASLQQALLWPPSRTQAFYARQLLKAFLKVNDRSRVFNGCLSGPTASPVTCTVRKGGAQWGQRLRESSCISDRGPQLWKIPASHIPSRQPEKSSKVVASG